MKLIISLLFSLLLVTTDVVAQQKSPSVQISGIVIDRDSLNPIAFTAIVVKHTTQRNCERQQWVLFYFCQ